MDPSRTPQESKQFQFSRETLIKSAAVDGERFFVKTRFEKRGNTVCISRFSNRRIGGKDPSSAVGDLFRGSLESGFPSARYAVRVALFAPVEYLTYEIRSVSDSISPYIPQ